MGGWGEGPSAEWCTWKVGCELKACFCHFHLGNLGKHSASMSLTSFICEMGVMIKQADVCEVLGRCSFLRVRREGGCSPAPVLCDML